MGYPFVGWLLNGQGDLIEDGATASNLSSQKDGTATLVAQWEKGYTDISLTTAMSGDSTAAGLTRQFAYLVSYPGFGGEKIAYTHTAVDGSAAADELELDSSAAATMMLASGGAHMAALCRRVSA